jgi:hypothetical protein
MATSAKKSAVAAKPEPKATAKAAVKKAVAKPAVKKVAAKPLAEKVAAKPAVKAVAKPLQLQLTCCGKGGSCRQQAGCCKAGSKSSVARGGKAVANQPLKAVAAGGQEGCCGRQQ